MGSLTEEVKSDTLFAVTTPLSTMTRKFFVGGNWKMNGTKAQIDEICSWMCDGPLDPNCEVVVGVPGCYLEYTTTKLPSSISVAAQNCYKSEKGAFTGELSPQMIKDCGSHWVILGHSERRNVFGETDTLIGEKVGFALKSGLSVIPCIGEKLEEREAGITNEVCFRQLAAIANNIEDWTKVVICLRTRLGHRNGKNGDPRASSGGPSRHQGLVEVQGVTHSGGGHKDLVWRLSYCSKL